MKKTIISILVMTLFISKGMSQNIKTLPSVKIKTLNGKSINIQDIDNDGHPIVINFWATWCKPCIKELNAIAEEYMDWQEETNVKIIAVSIDDSRSMGKVAPFVNASDWEYEVYLDPNSDLKRAMGVSTVPHVFLLDENKNIIWEHRGYVSGDEEELLERIQEISK